MVSECHFAVKGKLHCTALPASSPSAPVLSALRSSLTRRSTSDTASWAGQLLQRVLQPPARNRLARAIYQLALKVSCTLTPISLPFAVIIDEEKRVKHSKLGSQIETVCSEPTKIGVKLDSSRLDIAYAPIVQSGGQYDIKPSAQSDDR